MSEALSIDAAMEAIVDMDSDAPEAVVEDEEEQVGEVEQEDAPEADNEDAVEEEVQADAEDDDDDPEEDPDIEDEEEEGDEPETAIEAPQFLDETEKEAFAALPREAQDMILKHDKQLVGAFTQKTQALAEERKAVESRKQRFESSITKLGLVVTEAEQRVEYYQTRDWAAAARDLPAEEYNQHRAQAEEAAQQLQQQRKQLADAEAEQFEAFTNEQIELMPKVAEELQVPEFNQPDAAEKVWKPLAEYLTKSGFTQDDIKFADARMSAVARKAQLWDEYQAKRKTKPALKPKSDAKSKGKPVRAGARASSSQRAPDKKRLQRFQRTGNKADAMELLKQFD